MEEKALESMSFDEMKKEIEWRAQRTSIKVNFETGHTRVSARPIDRAYASVHAVGSSPELAAREALRQLRAIPLPKNLRRL
jgi:hypothetical protein